MADLTDAQRLDFVRTLLVVAQQVEDCPSIDVQPRRGVVHDVVHAAYLISLPPEPKDGEARG